MKIKPEHLEQLKAAIIPHDTAALRDHYLTGDFPNADRVRDLNKRYRWDLILISKVKIGDSVGMKGGIPLYDYMNDDHIDTALRSFIPVLHGSAATVKIPLRTDLAEVVDAGKAALATAKGEAEEWRTVAFDLTLQRDAADKAGNMRLAQSLQRAEAHASSMAIAYRDLFRS